MQWRRNSAFNKNVLMYIVTRSFPRYADRRRMAYFPGSNQPKEAVLTWPILPFVCLVRDSVGLPV